MSEFIYRVIDDDHKLPQQDFDNFRDALDYAKQALIGFIFEYPIINGEVLDDDDEGEIVWSWDDTWSDTEAMEAVEARHATNEDYDLTLYGDPDIAHEQEADYKAELAERGAEEYDAIQKAFADEAADQASLDATAADLPPEDLDDWMLSDSDWPEPTEPDDGRWVGPDDDIPFPTENDMPPISDDEEDVYPDWVDIDELDLKEDFRLEVEKTSEGDTNIRATGDQADELFDFAKTILGDNYDFFNQEFDEFEEPKDENALVPVETDLEISDEADGSTDIEEPLDDIEEPFDVDFDSDEISDSETADEDAETDTEEGELAPDEIPEESEELMAEVEKTPADESPKDMINGKLVDAKDPTASEVEIDEEDVDESKNDLEESDESDLVVQGVKNKQKLAGTDNAVKKCKANPVIAHCEDDDKLILNEDTDESLEETVPQDLADDRNPKQDTTKKEFNKPTDATEMRKHEAGIEDVNEGGLVAGGAAAIGNKLLSSKEPDKNGTELNEDDDMTDEEFIEAFGKQCVARKEATESLEEDIDDKVEWICVFDEQEVGSVWAATEDEAYDEMMKEYPELPYGLYDGCFYVFRADDKEVNEIFDANIGVNVDAHHFGGDNNDVDVLSGGLSECDNAKKVNELFDANVGVNVDAHNFGGTGNNVDVLSSKLGGLTSESLEEDEDEVNELFNINANVNADLHDFGGSGNDVDVLCK